MTASLLCLAANARRPPAQCGGSSISLTRSDGLNVLGLRALRGLGDLEIDTLVLVQRAGALALGRRVVHEDVGAAAVLSNEAEALLSVEPLHRTLCHAVSSRGRTATDTVPVWCAVIHPHVGAVALASGAREHQCPGRIRHPWRRSTQEIRTAARPIMPCSTRDASVLTRRITLQ